LGPCPRSNFLFEGKKSHSFNQIDSCGPIQAAALKAHGLDHTALLGCVFSHTPKQRLLQ
jgi:hypothetical protein